MFLFNFQSKEVSSQMLLLCAWRSVKELALFLGQFERVFLLVNIEIPVRCVITLYIRFTVLPVPTKSGPKLEIT
jgi:hypothetical protein